MNDLIIKTALAILANRPKPILHFLERHFGKRPDKFPIVRVTFDVFRHGCIERAMQNYIAQPGVRARIVGVASTSTSLTMSELINLDESNDNIEGPRQFVDVALPDGSNLSCNLRSVYLIRDNGKRFAVFINVTNYEDKMSVEVIARDRDIGADFVAHLRQAVDTHSIYRGKVLTLKDEYNEGWALRFRPVPHIDRSQLILPAETLAEIERQTIRFSEHSQLLRARGQHLKRGLLLWGPPGTGKSLTIMYLLGSMPGRTTIIVTCTNAKHLEDACQLARALQPATVVIDDVDLIATKRQRSNSNPLLFELLNQMDGIAEDADVLFVLTTNEPEKLESALASRPGRVDQAIMIPLPDDECRERLFGLYGKDLPMAVEDMRSFIARTDGVNAAFIRELFRKAALLAAERGADAVIDDECFEKALRLLRDNPLTSRVLGCGPLSEADHFDQALSHESRTP